MEDPVSLQPILTETKAGIINVQDEFRCRIAVYYSADLNMLLYREQISHDLSGDNYYSVGAEDCPVRSIATRRAVALADSFWRRHEELVKRVVVDAR